MSEPVSLEQLDEEWEDEGIAILDETDDFIAEYVSCSDVQRWAMVLYAVSSNIIDVCATFPRMLFASEEEESGKTLAMELTAALCYRTIDAAGTPYDLTAALAEASMEPEKPVPAVKRDEIGEVFPNGGQSRGNNVVADILRRGYKKGATRGRARGGTSNRFSIFTPFLMTGLRTSVPRDIRTRCIVITMQRGKPKRYFDVRDGEAAARDLALALRYHVRQHMDEIAAFRAINLGIPSLHGRKAEVWEPLLAVAAAMGGKKWLARAISAFRALSLSEADTPELSPRQKMVQLCAEVAADINLSGFTIGNMLSDEIRHREEFAGQSDARVKKLISDALPCNVVVVSLGERGRMSAYRTQEILDAWERIKPVDPDELEEPEEEDPFAVQDDVADEEVIELDDVSGTSGTSYTGVYTTAQQKAAPPPQPDLVPFEVDPAPGKTEARKATRPVAKPPAKPHTSPPAGDA